MSAEPSFTPQISITSRMIVEINKQIGDDNAVQKKKKLQTEESSFKPEIN